MKLHPMVIFSGNCREALEFYRDCFGGKLYFEGLPDSVKARMPCAFRNIVLKAKLVTRHFTIYASDLGETTARGRISLFVNSRGLSELQTVFEALSRNGAVVSKPDAGEMGVLVDQFGVEWMFAVE